MRTPVNSARLLMMLEDIMLLYRVESTILVQRYIIARTNRARRRIIEHARQYSLISKVPHQLKHLDRLIHVTDVDCIVNLRMDRNTFGKLCRILTAQGGLSPGKGLGIEEHVVIFLGVLAHPVVRFSFFRSGSIVSHYINKVLGAVLSLHTVVLSKPKPVADDCIDHRWKWFKGCLGALDGTHINVLVGTSDKPRSRTQGCGGATQRTKSSTWLLLFM
ncbi:uncharacterized protein LOC121808099 isoform X1 [Salvia splendens]|uniref:uncharacterized protein LOC121808099 isoform X1 n=1 Tax=Salvia splendens TaxID=180675 RepID=UPI001C27DCD4|nr:uncharacterized protein LOC121808099 isoform X1 [Salvia splendens]XP_042064392.1 uncharacterized protein LOC121808099 isoform X1 [Salvia splendens]